MRPLVSSIATLMVVTAAGTGCSSNGTTPPPDPVLTTVTVTPATATLFIGAPGNTATLAVAGKDQDGGTMTGLVAPTFSSDNDATATVSGDGTVTAVAAGTAQITASLTAGSVTKTGSATVTAQEAPASASVSTPGLAFQAPLVDVRVGGSVTWTIGATTHNVTFTSPGAPASIGDLNNASAARTFPSNGSFNYHCTIHPQMTGLVRVH
ncbi:MAG: Ig-like domain-containing protein [Gemmatimonadales bacterium]